MEVMFFCIKMIVFLHFLTISVFHMIIYKYLGKKDLRKDNNDIFIIATPYMIDAEDNISENVAVALEESEEGFGNNNMSLFSNNELKSYISSLDLF